MPFPDLSKTSLLILFAAALTVPCTANAWWNGEWSARKKVTLDTSAAGVAISEPIGTAAVLIRLHDGNFQFAAAKEDGSDLRFVAADDKTPLPFQIEKYDGLLNEAFVWVKVPDLKAGAQSSFWIYFGEGGEQTPKTEDPKGTYDADTVLVYHFGEKGAPAADATKSANNAETAGTLAEGSMIGSGLRLTGQTPINIPASASLAWSSGGAMTWSAWVKSGALVPNAVIFSRREGNSSFLVGEDNGVPFVEINGERSAKSEPLTAGGWHHLAVVTSGAQTALFLDGEPYTTLKAGLPVMNSVLTIGGDTEPAPAGTTGSAPPASGQGRFVGELDELEISKVARPAGLIKLAALSQGGEKAAKLLVLGNDEQSGHGGEGELAKHLSLITDISKSLTIDGWIVIGLCTLLAVVGWIVTVMKFMYLTRIKKATDAFLKQWEHLSADFHVLDHGDDESIKSMGGKANAKAQKVLRQSPLYHIYKIGSAEIQHRVTNAREGFLGLSGRSMQAIRATLDGGLVREVQRLNSNLVFLTIGIAGGPYLGLLGTVIGVMITFAVIAKSGAVEVNSIAPGIAGALLATVAGLAVAIPALFAYSYISSRIKDAVSEMQIFIDEFVAKIAEAFPSPNE